MRSLGLDVGDKRIGVALSDPVGILASPLTIINCHDEKTDIEAIISIAEENLVKKIIVGLPRSMDGSIGQQAQKVQAFTMELRSLTSIPIEFRDERLSTVSALRLKKVAGAKRGRAKTGDDAIAAAVILQTYLDETL